VDAFEVNFAFPNGICGFQNNGNKRVRHVEYEIQYRVYGSGSGWTSKPGVYALKNINGLGFTERFDLSSPGWWRFDAAARAGEQQRERQHVLAGAQRSLSRPTSYAGISTIGITVETGGQLAAQSDKRVSVVATMMAVVTGQSAVRSCILPAVWDIATTRSTLRRSVRWRLPTGRQGENILITRQAVTARQQRIFSTK
jgi:hypothetical protein